MGGWIKISREIEDHWLWQDADRLRWWIDMLFMASFEDKKVIEDTHLITIKKGQFIASVAFLCKRWGKSNKTIIKYLKLLEEDEMICREVLHRKTPIITICNYDKYQCDVDTIVDTMVYRQNDEKIGCKVDKQILESNINKSDSLGHKEKTDIDTIVDRQVYSIVYTNKEYNNNIVDDDVNTARAHEDENLVYIEELKQSEIWLEQMQMRFRLNADELKEKLDIFALDCRCRGTEHKNLNETRRHFNDWLRIQIESQNRNNNEANRRKPENKRRGSDVTATKAEDYDGAF